jgi:hypothetical protein
MDEVTIEGRVCTDCSSTIDDGDELIINEHAYCKECAFLCFECETIYAVSSRGREFIADEWYCWDCATQCERCNDGVRNDDTHTVDNESWCDYCYENHSYYCENCCESSSESTTYVGDTPYCEGCYSDNCYYCDDCDESYHNDYPCDCRESDTVEGKCCRAYRSSGTIHDYSCKPAPIFKGTSKRNMYLGFELETEMPNVDSASLFASSTLLGTAYLKHDGSISSGFEIVTHPHTHQEYRENSTLLWNTIETLRKDYDARSWDTDTCGLHIHLSRDGFSSGAHLHRFIAFVYHNAPHMMKFAGRKSRFARFNDVYTFDEYDRPVFSIKHKVGNPNRHSTERYSAVNTQNKHTIELRFFRGTMKTSGVLSALDLAQAMVEYTRELRLDDVKLGALSWEWFADYVVSNNGLYPDLYSRLDKIQSVDINNKITANA